MLTFDALEETAFENFVGKEEMLVNRYFLPFLPYERQI